MSDMIIDSTSYTNKDFRSIFPELLQLTSQLTSLWDPVNSNESDPGVVLLKLQAFIADKLNYNIDKNALENFPSSVTQRGNAQKIYDLVGYNMKGYQSATTEVAFKYTRGENSEDLPLDSYIIPKYTQLKDDKGTIVYTLLSNAVVYTDNSSAATVDTLTAMEGSYQVYTINGSDLITINNLDADNRLYFNQTQIASNGIFIHNYEQDQLWEATDNLDATQLGQKVFKFGTLPTTNVAYVEFPQDAPEIFGRGIQLGYIISSGSSGNIGAKVLTQLFNELTITEGDNTYEVSKYTRVTNPKVAVNGKDPESLSEAYTNYQKTIGTFNTLVTLRDYEGAIYKENQIANCVVSDRTCDINNSYNIRVKNLGGDETKSFTTTEQVQTLVATDNGTEYQYRNQATMNAFNLAVYALNKVPSIYDEHTYNSSFQTGYSAQSMAQSCISDYKSIQHDWLDVIKEGTIFPFIFKNLVALNGKVFTHHKVSATEAEQIEKNINVKLYQTYHSRNVNFGQELEYEDLINTILSADTRIKSVMLDDPKVDTYVMGSNNVSYPLEYVNSNNPTIQNKMNLLKINLIAKSILAGVTPWCSFDTSASLAYTLKPVTGYLNPNSEGYEEQLAACIDENGSINLPTRTADRLNAAGSCIKDVTAITTEVDIPMRADGYTLRNNETVFFHSPSYLTTKQLSTYLYAYLKTGTEKTISANSLYELRLDDKLYVSENPTDLQGIVGENAATYVPTKRTWVFESTAASPLIIKPSFELKSNQVLNENTVEAFNLESSNTIDLMEVNKSVINETTSELNGQIQTRKKDIYAVWVVDNLNNQLFNEWTEDSENSSYLRSEHILQSNEIFIYTDSGKSDLVLLQSGTKLSVRAPKIADPAAAADNWTCATVALDDVQQNGTSANFDWKPISRSLTFTAQEMQIETIGAGCTIYCTDASLTKLNNTSQAIVNPEKISWVVDGTSYSLPGIDSSAANHNEYGWYGFSRLSLVATPAHPFTLADYVAESIAKGSIQKICAFKSNRYFDEDTQEYALEYVPAAIFGPGQSIATSAVTMLSGGTQQSTATLEADQTYSSTLTLSVYSFYDVGAEDNTEKLMSVAGGIVQESYEETQCKFQFRPTAGRTEMTASLQLSGLFKNTIIPLALTSADPFTLTVLGVPTIDNCTIEIPEDPDADIAIVVPTTGTIQSAIPATNNVYYLYIKDISEQGYTLNFSLTKSGENHIFDANQIPATLTMFTPMRIDQISSILGVTADKNSNPYTVLDALVELGRTNVNLNSSAQVNYFDYTYQVDDDELISDPTDPLSFYEDYHIYNKYVISQLNTNGLNVKIAKQSKQ